MYFPFCNILPILKLIIFKGCFLPTRSENYFGKLLGSLQNMGNSRLLQNNLLSPLFVVLSPLRLAVNAKFLVS